MDKAFLKFELSDRAREAWRMPSTMESRFPNNTIPVVGDVLEFPGAKAPLVVSRRTYRFDGTGQSRITLYLDVQD